MCPLVSGGFFVVCFIVQDFQEVATDFAFPVVLESDSYIYTTIETSPESDTEH